MDDKGAATSETFNWVVKDVPPTDKGTLANQTYTDGQAGISISTSQGFNNPNSLPLTYSASGLPTGLAIDATSGKITGTIDKEASKGGQSTGSNGLLDGKYTVTVTADDKQGGTATQTFTIDSTNQAPIVGTKTSRSEQQRRPDDRHRQGVRRLLRPERRYAHLQPPRTCRKASPSRRTA